MMLHQPQQSGAGDACSGGVDETDVVEDGYASQAVLRPALLTVWPAFSASYVASSAGHVDGAESPPLDWLSVAHHQTI